jgi:hypothetical protein
MQIYKKNHILRGEIFSLKTICIRKNQLGVFYVLLDFFESTDCCFKSTMYTCVNEQFRHGVLVLVYW